MASEEPSGNGRISVSEDRLRLVIAEFKNEILREVKQFATASALEALEARVKALELWQAANAAQDRARKGISSAAFAWMTLAVSSLGFIATLVWLKTGK